MTSPAGICSAGYFCESGAIDTAGMINREVSFGLQKSGPCPAGFFCPAGSSVPSPCPAGTYCLGGNSGPSPCLPGTYNMEDKNVQCLNCPAGYLCSPGGVVDDERSDGVASIAFLLLNMLLQPPAVPSHSDQDMSKVMLACKLLLAGLITRQCCAIRISTCGQIQRTSPPSNVEEKPGEQI